MHTEIATRQNAQSAKWDSIDDRGRPRSVTAELEGHVGCGCSAIFGGEQRISFSNLPSFVGQGDAKSRRESWHALPLVGAHVRRNGRRPRRWIHVIGATVLMRLLIRTRGVKVRALAVEQVSRRLSSDRGANRRCLSAVDVRDELDDVARRPAAMTKGFATIWPNHEVRT